MRKIKAKVGNVRARLKINGMEWAVVVCLFAENTVSFAESEVELHRVVDEFPIVYCLYEKKAEGECWKKVR